MFNLTRWLLSLFLILLFVSFIIGSISFAKSKGEIQYELEEEYINNKNDLSWGEKAKARDEAYTRIFGKSDTEGGGCWLVCGGVILAIIIAGMAEAKKNPSVPKKKGPSTSDVFNALKKMNRSKDSKVISSSSSELTNNAETKKCPYCAEIIKKEAIVCRYCKKELANQP